MGNIINGLYSRNDIRVSPKDSLRPRVKFATKDDDDRDNYMMSYRRRHEDNKEYGLMEDDYVELSFYIHKYFKCTFNELKETNKLNFTVELVNRNTVKNMVIRSENGVFQVARCPNGHGNYFVGNKVTDAQVINRAVNLYSSSESHSDYNQDRYSLEKIYFKVVRMTTFFVIIGKFFGRKINKINKVSDNTIRYRFYDKDKLLIFLSNMNLPKYIDISAFLEIQENPYKISISKLRNKLSRPQISSP